MKNILTYIFIVLIFSCSSSKQERKLIGNWYSASENRIDSEFGFYKDTLVIYDSYGKSTLKWKVSEQKIYSSFLNENGPTYKYKLDQNNDSLNLELIGEKGFILPTLIKAKNAFDFFQKIIGLKIQLPIKETELEQIGLPTNLNFNVYAGFIDNNLKVKTDLASDLNNLENEVNRFKEHSRDELKRFLRFNLIADKNITESQMDSIKGILKQTSIERIFRTYQNKQADYKNNLNWFGQKE